MFKSRETTSEAKYHQSDDSDEKSMQEIIKSLRNFLSDEVIESIKEIFNQFNYMVRTIEDYIYIEKWHDKLIILVDDLMADGINHLYEQLTPDSTEGETNEQLNSLFHLKDLASKISYSKRIGFMRDILSSPDKKQILFSNVVLTEENINKRFRKLALYFHPDKTNGLYSPINLIEEYKRLSNELFKYLLELKNSLLHELCDSSKLDLLTFHEEKANEFWKIAIDYRNAYKAQWDKLKVLRKEELRKKSSEELKRYSNLNGRKAYEEYRAACKLADKDKRFNSQIKLRGYMALSLYISGQFLEAQVYALSAINLIYRSRNATLQDLDEAKKIFDKVKDGDPIASEKIPKLSTEIKSTNRLGNQNALVRIESLDQQLSYYEKKAMHRSINEDLENIGNELMLKADRSLVCYQANIDEVLHTSNRPLILRCIIATGIGLSVLIAGQVLLFGICMWRTKKEISSELRIRLQLNEIMEEALLAYDKGDYKKFIDVLSREYKSDCRLLTLKCCGDVVQPKEIIKALLKHGFRSDGIAYLLILIGEVLISGKIKIDGITADELKTQGSNIFIGVLSENLVTEAETLDGRIRELRKGFLKRFYNIFIDSIVGREHGYIAEKYKKDAEEMPFISRLEEMRNTARINHAIRDIINGGSEQIQRAKKTIKEVRKSIYSHSQYIGIAETRLEVLEDFLWVISGEEIQYLSIEF